MNYHELGKQISSKEKLTNLSRNDDRIKFNYESRSIFTDIRKKWLHSYPLSLETILLEYILSTPTGGNPIEQLKCYEDCIFNSFQMYILFLF